jgi:Family of unknown function (DUF6435)
MINLFKQHAMKRLIKEYERKLTYAFEAQRMGDMREYAKRTQAADLVYQQIKDRQQLEA